MNRVLSKERVINHGIDCDGQPIRMPSEAAIGDIENLLTIEDLVKRTQLPRSWWYSRTRETGPGSLKKLKCGKCLRFKWSDVVQYLESQQQA